MEKQHNFDDGGAENFLFFLSLPLNCGVAAADTILLQQIMPWTSSSRLTQSIHLYIGLPLPILPGGTTPESFFQRIIGITSSRVITTSDSLSYTSL